MAVRDQLVQAGRVEPHHILPDSGWVSVRIHGEQDVPAVIELFRLNYERAWSIRQKATEEPLSSHPRV